MTYSRMSLSLLALIGLVDAISYMAVAPSLIFYVLQVGGSKEIYGLILSSFSFASFCGKPLYGIWVDKGGNKFLPPYIVSLILAIVGGFFYFFGNFPGSSSTSILLIFLGRFLSGLGAANQTLGYTYIAAVVPHNQQTKINTILSMMRIFGMSLGPAVNLLLSKVRFSLTLGLSFNIQVDPLNSVGILLAVGNMLVLLCVLCFLEEPPPKERQIPHAMLATEPGSVTEEGRFWDSICSIEVLLPLVILLVVNSSFQLIETALPPAAADGLEWGPVETSTVLGSTSIVIFLCMILTMYLSGKVSDLKLVAIGNVLWVIGGTGIYWFWRRNASVFHYVIPVIVACAGFPFIAASNRSNFTKAVAEKPALANSVGLMQSVLSMAASVAGFVTPGFVASYVIRSVDEVSTSSDLRELTPVALYVPLLSFFALIGLWVQHGKERRAEMQMAIDDEQLDERSSLLLNQRSSTRRSSVLTIQQGLSPRFTRDRNMCAQVMGITAYDTKDEQALEQKLEKDLGEWEALATINFEEDGE